MYFIRHFSVCCIFLRVMQYFLRVMQYFVMQYLRISVGYGFIGLTNLQTLQSDALR